MSEKLMCHCGHDDTHHSSPLPYACTNDECPCEAFRWVLIPMDVWREWEQERWGNPAWVSPTR